ncbi:DUF1611 domain-containing protein [Ruminococcus sp.]|uniref:DUF1611 domain-containing protein n=1 Tax=Ruminococcus sp. TaxID=41978 RepID=UPI00258DDCA2|nr:DUF1611 domain-containing protein [Ruminococcus sp.]MCR5020530.1 DUF1611 domain-containing protein [Ruminococcus sp.]
MSDHGEIRIDNGGDDIIGHGSGVYGIIRNGITDPDVEFIIVKVTETEEEVVDEEVLIAALKFTGEHLQADIVNLSLCIRAAQHQSEMYRICREMSENGTVLSAAFDNGGAVSYPAAFDCVVGVTSNKTTTRNDQYIPIENTYVNVVAKGRPQRILWKDNETIIGIGDSLAAAHFTHILANNCLEAHCTPQEGLKLLQVNLAPAVSIGTQLPDWFSSDLRAAVFPYNKEMHSVVRYAGLMRFSLTDVYDIRRSGKVGRSVPTAEDSSIVVKNIAAIDYNTFDVLIVGHLQEVCLIDKTVSAERIILDALTQGKYVYSLDDYDTPEIMKYKREGSFFSPQIHIDLENLVPMGKLFINTVPVVGVFGTKSQQGKWTLQLELRKRLLADNYRVAQLGTEPTAYLFGMDECFHFGYNGRRNYGETEKLAHINMLLHRMEQKDPEIIISGSQSQTVTAFIGNISGYSFDQYTFLQGLQPDAVILSVCIEDAPEYISATVRFLESAVDCHVIGAVLFPVKFYTDHKTDASITDLEYEEFRSKIQEACPSSLPLYRLEKQADLDRLYESMIDYFSE